MRFEKNTTLLLAIILSSTTLAAPTKGSSTSISTTRLGQIPSTVLAPLPTEPTTAPKQAVSSAPALSEHGPSKRAASSAVPALNNQTSIAANNQSVSADTLAMQAASVPQPVAEGELNVPYETMLPKGAELVAGDPTRNEFFIVAAEDAMQIKKLLERTKPNAELAANDIKSKQPILKVKLDGAHATLVSMDVVSSIHEVVKSAKGPKVAMTGDDEVLSIFTKNRITPVGSRAVAPIAAPVAPTLTTVIDEKPMLKLLAAQNAEQSGISNKITESINPLASVTQVRPVKGTMPDKVAMQQTIQQPIEKPVVLPPVSKEAGPTLEMVLQQAKNGKSKANNEVINSASNLKSKLVVVTPTVKSKPISIGAPMSAQLKHAVVKAAADKKKVVAAGEIIPYEALTAVPAKPINKKTNSWKVRHKAQVVEVKKVAVERPRKNTKTALQVGVVKNYADYLTKTGQKADHSME